MTNKQTNKQTVQTFSCRNLVAVLLLVLLRMYLYYTNSYLLSHFLFIARLILSVSLANNKHYITVVTVVKLQFGSASALYIAPVREQTKQNKIQSIQFITK